MTRGKLRHYAIGVGIFLFLGFIASFASRGSVAREVRSELSQTLQGAQTEARIQVLTDREVQAQPLDADIRETPVRRGVFGSVVSERKSAQIAAAPASSGYSGWQHEQVRVLGPFLTLADYDGQSWFGSRPRRYGRFIHGRRLDLAIFGWSYTLGEWSAGGSWHGGAS